MAKSKAEDQATPDATEAPASAEVQVSPEAEAAKAAFDKALFPEVVAKKYKFQLVTGGHDLGSQGIVFGPCIVESDDDLAAIFGTTKFRPVE